MIWIILMKTFQVISNKNICSEKLIVKFNTDIIRVSQQNGELLSIFWQARK